MMPMMIVLLLSVLVVLGVFRLCTKNVRLSRGGLLIAAVVRAVIPLSAAVGIGSWQVINALRSVAADGSGAVGVVAAGAEQFVRTLLIGVTGFTITLLLALFLVARRRANEPDTSGVGASARRLAASVGILIVVASLGATW